MSSAVAVQFPEAPADISELLTEGQIGSEVFAITPEVAAQWLEERNTDNRPMSGSIARNYARQIRQGAWRVTHQGIGFDSAGVLLDGQHRLKAIVDSETAVPMMVSWNLEREVFAALDTGKGRNAQDALSLHLGEKPQYLSLLVSTIRTSHVYCRALGLPPIGGVDTAKPTNQEIIAMMDEMSLESLSESAAAGHAMYIRARANGVPISATVSAVFHYLMVNRGGWNADLIVEDFLTPVVTGIGLQSEKDPRAAMRRAAIRENGGKKNIATRVEMLGMLIKAFNDWIANKQVRHIARPNAPLDIPEAA